MNISIPIGYKTYVISVRTGRNEDKRFGFVIEAEIPEIESWQAPLAARWRTVIRNREDRTLETRWHDGSHWRRLDRFGGQPGAVSADEFELACRTGAPQDGAIGRARREHGLWTGKDGKVVRCDPRHWIGNPKAAETAEEQMRAALANYVAIDGEMWERCGEPVYRIVRDYDGEPDYVAAVAMDDDWNGLLEDTRRSGPMDVYRADRKDEVIAEFVEQGGRLTEAPLIEIHLPEAIRYRDDATALLWAAEDIVKFRANHRLDDLPAQEVVAWGALKQKLAAVNGPDDDENLEGVAEAIRSYIDTATFTRQRAEGALFRWSTRSIDLAETGFNPRM